MDKTLSTLITDIEKELYQVAGLSTQVYAQDKLAQNVENAFLTFFSDDKERWKRFQTFETFTLDGTTGRTTTPIADTFASWDDILQVFPAESDRALVKANSNVNPARITGDQPLQRVYDPVDLMRVLPITATGDIVVVGRALPTMPFALANTVPFDSLAIKWHACWQYAIDDGANPGTVAKFQELFNERYKTLSKNQASEAIPLNGRGRHIPDRWYTQ